MVSETNSIGTMNGFSSDEAEDERKLALAKDRTDAWDFIVDIRGIRLSSIVIIFLN